MTQLIEGLGTSAILLVLVFLVYWVMEWIKKVLKDKLDDIYTQPICLILGTLISTGIMYNYDFKPLNLGDSKLILVDYLVQGAILASLAGSLYDKFFKKTEPTDIFID